MITAINLGSTTAITANTVVFAADPGVSAFFTNIGTDFTDSVIYGGGAIGTLSDADAQTLLDSLEFGPGAGNSLARLSGLTVGRTYQVQILIVDDREDNTESTSSFGYSTPSGDLMQIYPLTGVDHSSSSPIVVTGTFTASETLQDLHVGPDNGIASAYQLRDVTALPEPSTFVLGALGFLGLGVVARRKKCRRN